MFEVEKISLLTIIMYFVAYIISHIVIGIIYKNKSKSVLNNPIDLDLQKNMKKWEKVNKWFPAIYVVFLILVLGFG